MRKVFDDSSLSFDQIVESGKPRRKYFVIPRETKIDFPSNPSSTRSFDFAPFYGNSCDAIVAACQAVLEQRLTESVATSGQTSSVSSIVGTCYRLKKFFKFCITYAEQSRKNLQVTDIDKSLIARFIDYLAEDPALSTSHKSFYGAVKTVLMGLASTGDIDPSIFPKNPYPRSNFRSRSQQPLSKAERKSVTYALKVDLDTIAAANTPLNTSELSVCVLAIAMRTGLNPTPILELSIDCIHAHPFKSNRKLLVSHKRRGRNTRIQAMRASRSVQSLNTVMMDVIDVIEMVLARNKTLRGSAAEPTRLFTYSPAIGKRTSQSLPLVNHQVHQSTRRFVERHNIRDDRGEPLVLNVMRLRKTFVNRLWELSGQDPFVTAALAGHTVRVSDNHYLEAPKSAEADWRLMGEIRVHELVNSEDTEKTPVARCSDPLRGALAPKNGTYCTNFLACFRCTSFVVTSDDLYRLFSFYWLVVRERSRVGAKKWGQYYSHIVRIIDRQIAPQFDSQLISEAKARAKATPHPYWKGNTNVLLEIK